MNSALQKPSSIPGNFEFPSHLGGPNGDLAIFTICRPRILIT